MLETRNPHYLDIRQLIDKIRKKHITFTSHISEIEQRQGRPNREVVSDFLKNHLDRLREARVSRKNRIILIFYASSKYNLRIVSRLGDKNLYVVSYNWLLKKVKRPFRRRVPTGKK